MAAVIIGLIIANSPWGHWLFAVEGFHLSIDFLNLDLSMKKRISDLLLAVFILVAGPELKYELTSGMLSKASIAFVPVLVGIGGVAVSALVLLGIYPQRGIRQRLANSDSRRDCIHTWNTGYIRPWASKVGQDFSVSTCNL
jgi:Na+/H+ antiporter NhaA